MTSPAIPSSDGLEITVDHHGKDALVQVRGRINLDSSPDLRDRLRALLSEQSSSSTVIVDLADVPYIETSGVATLIEALRTAHHRQINLHLQGLSGAVLRLFEVIGVLAMFQPSGQEQKV